MTIAITGAKGRLGSWFVRKGFVPLECDITDRDQVREAIAIVQPRTIINCAAWTDVDGAEDENNVESALGVNLRGAAILRQEHVGLLVHISTSFIFDGKSGPYTENDIPNPLSWYGWTKFGGEGAILIQHPTLIVRTDNLFGPIGKTDFVRSIRDVLELGVPYQLPTNLIGSPTYIPHLAEGILSAERLGIAGVLNIVGDTAMSRYNFGRMIAEVFGYDPDIIEPTDVITGVAVRPLRGGLSVEKALSIGVPIYTTRDGLNALAEWSDET